jgi:glycosyltransferase involved in cell wall biosynthesis
MKIGINCQHIDQMPSGPAVYLRNLLVKLAEIDKVNEYRLYINSFNYDGFIEDLLSKNPRFETVLLDNKISWTQLRLAFELIKNPVDVLFSSVHTIPVITALLKPNKMKFISMIHGLEYLTNSNANFFQPVVLGTTIFLSDAVIVPSKSTKDNVIKHFSNLCNEQKIQVVHEGLKPIFIDQTSEQKDSDRILQEFGVNKDNYLIFVSTIQPRKNLPATIEAFARIVKEHKHLILCVVGKKGWNWEKSLGAPKKYNIENNVKFLGPVEDTKLRALMQNARGFVNFSFDEGFGLPLIEAMACGIPCAVSDINAHREIGGNFPIFANPESITEIAGAINRIINVTQPQEIKRSQILHAKSFNWENTAKTTLGIIQSTFKNL